MEYKIVICLLAEVIQNLTLWLALVGDDTPSDEPEGTVVEEELQEQ